MQYREIITHLKKHSNPKYKEGMARFGINPKYALGVRVPVIKKHSILACGKFSTVLSIDRISY